jgi:tetratricopeptide (TPR) repeat protein
LGHSPTPKDIMYMDVSDTSVSSLSARDKETIRKFYGEDIGESWLALSDAGTAAMHKQDYQTALDYFARAAKLTDDVAVKNNAAAAHFNWAIALMTSGNKAKAEEHFKAAFDIQSQVKEGKNYALILNGYAKFLRSEKRDAEAAAVEKLVSTK